MRGLSRHCKFLHTDDLRNCATKLAGVSGHTHTYSNIPVSLRRREEDPAGFLGGGTEPLLPLHNLAQRR